LRWFFAGTPQSDFSYGSAGKKQERINNGMADEEKKRGSIQPNAPLYESRESVTEF
jgi:hypothetical protein